LSAKAFAESSFVSLSNSRPNPAPVLLKRRSMRSPPEAAALAIIAWTSAALRLYGERRDRPLPTLAFPAA